MNRTYTRIGIAVLVLLVGIGAIVISNLRPWDPCGHRGGIQTADEVIERLQQAVETQNPQALCPAVDPSVSKEAIGRYINDVAKTINDHGGIDKVMFSDADQLGRGYHYTINDKQTGDVIYYISIASYHRGLFEQIGSISFVSEEYFYIQTEV